MDAIDKIALTMGIIGAILIVVGFVGGILADECVWMCN